VHDENPLLYTKILLASAILSCQSNSRTRSVTEGHGVLLMKALVLKEYRNLVYEVLPTPEAGVDDALIRVARRAASAGATCTDITAARDAALELSC